MLQQLTHFQQVCSPLSPIRLSEACTVPKKQNRRSVTSYRVFFFFLAIAAKCQKSFNLKPEETVIPASSQWNAKLRQVLRMCKCHRDSVLQRSH